MKTDANIVEAIQHPHRDECRIDINGTPLYVYADNYRVDVRTQPNGFAGTCYFSAHINTNFSGKRYIEFSIRTKQEDGTHYTGMYASELVRLAIEYFRKKKRIDGLYAVFEKTTKSDNYTQYQAAIDQGLSPEQALQHTPSWKHVQDLGFKKPRLLSEDDATVEFIFE